MSDTRELVCPHCGRAVQLVDGRLQVPPAPDRAGGGRDAGSVWDRKAEAGWPRRAAGAASEPFGGASRPERKKPEVDFPWMRRKADTLPPSSAAVPSPAAEVPAREAPARETPAREAPAREAAARETPARAAAEPSRPARAERPAVPAGAGPTVLDALETDPILNAGQRETIRTVYARFAPRATTSAHGKPGLTVREVLDGDPYLNRGQVETILMLYDRFVPKR
jgi:hypothetical protein